MRIAFICKRHYTGKDVITDRYGRLYEFPKQLALLGHHVQAWCLDYRSDHDDEQTHIVPAGSLAWSSQAAGGLQSARLTMYPFKLLGRLQDFKPDVLIGASDIPHVALTAWSSRRLGIPCVIDLYDNFESFGQARIPGFLRLLKYAVHNANLTLTVSHALKQKIQADYRPTNPVIAIPNGINTSVFSPGSRDFARQSLGLPGSAQLIGTAGGLSRMKGLDTVYSAWKKLEQTRPNLHLVLAGPVEKGLPPPTGERVHYLGEMPETRVADMFRALDVGIISLADSPFGRYCFPQKAYEMLGCHLPVVVSNTGEMSSLFATSPHVLFDPNDVEQLVVRVQDQLERPVVPAIPIPDWRALVAKLDAEIQHLSSRAKRN